MLFRLSLLGARIRTTTATEHCYVSIDELDSIFSDRASNVLTGQASMSVLRGSFASIVTDSSTVVIILKTTIQLSLST